VHSCLVRTSIKLIDVGSIGLLLYDIIVVLCRYHVLVLRPPKAMKIYRTVADGWQNECQSLQTA
jgi:hypothetical protein